jgi:hypothetical protein
MFGGPLCDQCAPGTVGVVPDCHAVPSDYTRTQAYGPTVATGLRTCFGDTAVMSCPGDPAQSTCSTTPGCGQDAQFPSEPRQLVRTQEGDQWVVTDQATGLRWLDEWTTTYSDFAANPLASCGSRPGWSYPSLQELASLILESGDASQNPVSALLFPPEILSGTGAYLLTSQRCAAFANNHWFIQARNGLIRNQAAAGVAGQTLCVQRPTGPVNAPFTRYTSHTPVAGQDVWRDRVTGLWWSGQQSLLADGRTWFQALSYCQGMSLGGQTDWRLPNVKELLSVVDYTRHSPSATMSAMQVANYWSSTTRANTPASAVVISFGEGKMELLGKTSAAAARCVRGPAPAPP